MSRLAKTSKYRHTAAKAEKTDKCFTDCKVNNLIWDCSNLIDANLKYLAFAWASAGGGRICIREHAKPGKVTSPSLLTGHSSQVIDWKFHPFNQSLIATGSDDCTVKVWQIPETLEGDIPAMVTHTGHGKKVGVLSWHPSAEHVLASAGMDHQVKLWDVENGERGQISCHKEQVSSVNWNLDGSLINTTSKDKKLRIIDPRTGDVVAETHAHDGPKTIRSVWAKRRNQIITCGFSKTHARQMMIWDPRNLEAAVYKEDIDSASGVLFPFIDEDTNLLYLAGKGDGAIRSYEVWDEETPVTELDCYSSSTPAKGVCFLPRTALDVKGCEVARALKIENNTVVPISYRLPRKTAATEFQADVYPDSFSPEPAITAKEFFAGTNAEPKTVEMKGFWEGTAAAGGSSGPVTMTSQKLISAEDVAAAEKKVADAEEALAKAKDELEALKAKKAEQEAGN
eukprot:TRINITY_DN319_c0_g8_i1.p1 TRINITY_DN319_c0_g8~~TRINITY_DN319_c0_g8_i1.p1  ORF type:complete len:454 (+),score=215.56 TRINITY_DN319_c0_g8_i1:58-1419(+)